MTLLSSAISFQAIYALIAIESRTGFGTVVSPFVKLQFYLKSGTHMMLRPPVSVHCMSYPVGLLVERKLEAAPP